MMSIAGVGHRRNMRELLEIPLKQTYQSHLLLSFHGTYKVTQYQEYEFYMKWSLSTG
jgi:hypothetical protein